MDFFVLAVALLLPWAAGFAAVVALPRRARALDAPGEMPWALGAGAFAGWLLLTLWMRLLAVAGAAFSVASVALPLAVAAAALAGFLWQRRRGPLLTAGCGMWRALRGEGLATGQRVLWWSLLGWLTLRFVVLLLEVTWRPLYPWDAWIQWATKARVWYELRTLVPFERTAEWFAANGAAYFDAAPNYPATAPLIQVWVNLLLGRWDDAQMNLPWWQFSLGLTFVAYGALRRIGYGALGALAGAWIVASLPLMNTHVALAGYADLPMACYLTLAALSLWRWIESRERADLGLALLFAGACPLIKVPGVVWAATLVPGLVVALMPRHGIKIVGIAFGVVFGALLLLARVQPVVMSYRLHLDFSPAWGALAESYFLLGNWHIFWYGIVAVAVLGWRELRSPRLLPLTMIVATGLVFLFIVFAFTNARAWVADQTTVNRATMHIVPLLAVWALAVFHGWSERLRAMPAPQPA